MVMLVMLRHGLSLMGLRPPSACRPPGGSRFYLRFHTVLAQNARSKPNPGLLPVRASGLQWEEKTMYTVLDAGDSSKIYGRGLTAEQAMHEHLTYDGHRYEIRKSDFQGSV